MTAPVTLYGIPPGEAGAKQTCIIMRDLIRKGRANPLVRQTAAALVRYLPQKDYLGEAAAVHAFVRDCVRYVRDIRDVETLHAPEFILQNGYGDCDDKSILAASMLESLGHKTRLHIVGPERGRGFCHVYVDVFIDGAWHAVECTEPVQFGWAPPDMKNHFVREV